MPGPYSVCHVTFPGGQDSATYRTLSSGFNSASDADDALADLASNFDVSWQECVVIRLIGTSEINQFSS
mgnify:CR=1 FL=1